MRSMTAAAMLSSPKSVPQRENSRFVVMIRLHFFIAVRDDLAQEPGALGIDR
jgi:hypothetical protein